MDLSQLRTACLERVLDEGMRPVEAVDKTLADTDVGDETFVELAREGLRYHVDKDLSAARRAGPDYTAGNEVAGGEAQPGRRSGKFQHRPHHTERGVRWYWLSKQFSNAEGEPATLLDFRSEDFEHWSRQKRAEADSRIRVAEFFDHCKGEIESSAKATRLQDLPAKTLAELDGRAASVLQEVGE